MTDKTPQIWKINVDGDLTERLAIRDWGFMDKVIQGDIIVGCQTWSEILAIGVVEDDLLLKRKSAKAIGWKIRDKVDISPTKLDITVAAPVNQKLWQKIIRAYLNKNRAYKTIFDNLGVDIVIETNKVIKKIETTLERTRNVILFGPPGTGKTYHAREFAEYWTENNSGLELLQAETGDQQRPDFVQTITFHQSYGYEDFVEGLRPLADKKGDIRYEWRPGIFKQMCDAAVASPNNRFILIIDEINRGNIAKIFGELITLLEDDKRVGQNNQMTVSLPGTQERFGVPANLYIIGTMNTADRSIALLDIALRRRFTFIELTPDPDMLEEENFDDIDLAQLLTGLNARVEKLLDRDHCIGHSYLMNLKDLSHLYFVWYQRIIPLLQEYFYNDGQRLQAVLGDFIELKKAGATNLAIPLDWFDDDDVVSYQVVELSGAKFKNALQKIAADAPGILEE